MRKYLLLITGLLIILYVLYFKDPFVFFRFPERLTYLRYGKLFGELARLCLIFVFVIIIGLKPSATSFDKKIDGHARWWGWGFGGLLLPLLASIIYVNPHGAFPWMKFSETSITAYVPTAARTQKINLFNELTLPPEVVVFGSSRAFTISSSYVMERTGYRTFNMAVNGGGPLDFQTFGRFVLSRETTPLAIVVELVNPGLNVRQNPMPVSMIPYLDLNEGLKTTDNIFHDVISIQSLSDMIYLITDGLFSQTQPVMVFMPDGTGIRAPWEEDEYRLALERKSGRLDQSYKCTALNVEAMGQLEDLVSLAEENEVGILFYRSPLNADYLDISAMNHPLFQKCENLFHAYMNKLMSEHSNIFFIELTYYEPIGSLRYEGYFDAQHLQPGAARLLVDKISADIQKAGEWAIYERSHNSSE